VHGPSAFLATNGYGQSEGERKHIQTPRCHARIILWYLSVSWFASEHRVIVASGPGFALSLVHGTRYAAHRFENMLSIEMERAERLHKLRVLHIQTNMCVIDALTSNYFSAHWQEMRHSHI